MNNRELITENDNRSIFENNFTISKFSNNYKKMMEEIYKENNESENSIKYEETINNKKLFV